MAKSGGLSQQRFVAGGLEKMWKFKALVLCVIFNGTLCSTLKTSSNSMFEDTITSLKQRMNKVEERVLTLEDLRTSDLVQKVKDEILGAFQETEKRLLAENSQLMEKMEEMETASIERQSNFAEQLHELEQNAKEEREEMSRRLSEVEMSCAKSIDEVSGRLQDEKDRLLKMGSYLSTELQKDQEKLAEALEKVRSVEDEVRKVLESERSKTDILLAKGNETREMLDSILTSQRDVEDVIRKNISSSAENQLHIKESLIFGLENMQSNFTDKMRTLENSLLTLEKDCANASYVSNLHESLQNLDKITRTDLQSIKIDLNPRVMQLEEERFHLRNNVTEIEKTQKNHTSEIHALNEQLFYSLKPCAGEPPSLRNGKPVDFGRTHGSSVQYKCDRNFVMTGESTVRCIFGDWEGHPPVCSFFDSTFYLEVDRYYLNHIDCYGDEKIGFSYVPATGSTRNLPMNTTSSSTGIDLSGVTYTTRFGAYQCGFNEEGRSMDIVVPLQIPGYLYFLDPFRVVNIGDDVELEVLSFWQGSIRWMRNGTIVLSWNNKQLVKIGNVQPADAGVYECHYEEDESSPNPSSTALMTLIVRRCKANLYGGHCDQTCPPCYNGGICHDLLGICVCPQGFAGNNCERACREGYHGVDCSKQCRKTHCKFTVHCKPDPYGCSCARGWTGKWCSEKCDPGWYGAGCKQPCHCKTGSGSCNPATGACIRGCSSGWTGESCQIEVLD